MIVQRRSGVHDRRIYRMVKTMLLPISRKTFPTMNVSFSEIRERLNSGTAYVALHEGQSAAGFVLARKVGDAVWVDMLAVDAKARHRGYGSLLLSRAELYGSRAGCSAAHLFVDDRNASARRFYEKRGYRPQRFYPEIGCHLYAKTLKSNK
jgi:ribosomal protein S18 acetylase RimI-like enzyme